MIPSFLTWLENDENPALGMPMHKKGPEKSFDREIEEKMLRLTKELMDGSRSEQDILAAVKQYVEKKMPSKEAPEQAQANDPQMAPGPDMGPVV